KASALLMRSRENGTLVCGKLRVGSAVHHRVGVLHTDAVGAVMGLHDIHDSVIGVFVCPVSLPFQHRGQRGHWLGTCLDNPLHRVVVCQLADVAATVLEDIDFVAIV